MKPTITPELAEVLDLLLADGRPGWAMRRLKLLGTGGYAEVFRHPSEPDLVIRVATLFDGWFAYAERLKQEADPVTRYGPRMHDMAYFKVGNTEFWVGLSERLQKIDRHDVPRAEVIRAVQGYAAPRRYRPAGESDLAMLATQPGLKEFLDRYCGDHEDFHAGNFMLRGEELVVNDPADDAMTVDIERLKALYHIDGRSRMEPEVATIGGMMP